MPCLCTLQDKVGNIAAGARYVYWLDKDKWPVVNKELHTADLAGEAPTPTLLTCRICRTNQADGCAELGKHCQADRRWLASPVRQLVTGVLRTAQPALVKRRESTLDRSNTSVSEAELVTNSRLPWGTMCKFCRQHTQHLMPTGAHNTHGGRRLGSRPCEVHSEIFLMPFFLPPHPSSFPKAFYLEE